MKLRNRIIAPPRVEMLPLIDIVFLLLVFFIYAMLSMAVHHGQQVDLPESSTAGLETTEAISITIQAKDDKDGKNSKESGLKIFIDEKQVELSQLAQLLKRKKTESKDKEPDVQIFADKSVSYQGLFQVLDRVRKAGLTHISLQAETETTTP
ncbi:MAG: biopolymer transporter ExbD [Candidatus Electrothrix sp. GM3_4]|nr:biopolymer transporter ExbD [Candidatus Electrothrix sp. GM3_4]